MPVDGTVGTPTLVACGDLDRDRLAGARRRAHAARVDIWVQPHLERRRRGEKHPVHDFLFTYYSQRPAALRRWHPGCGVALARRPGVRRAEGLRRPDGVDGPGRSPPSTSPRSGAAGRVGPPAAGGHRAASADAGLLRAARVGDGAPADRRRCATTGRCAWAAPAPTTVVESHRITCSHFDAFRFFTDTARPLNTLQPGRDDRPAYEQPGCLHAGMDLYKHAFRLSPLVPSELVADCFALAWDIRDLDMRASPYDFASLGFAPVRIETPEGKQEYVAAQRAFAERGAPLRPGSWTHCEELLQELPRETPRTSGSASLRLGPVTDQDNSQVVARFVQDGRLVMMPTKRQQAPGSCSTTSRRSSSPGGPTPRPRSTPCCRGSTTTTPPCVATSSTRAS